MTFTNISKQEITKKAEDIAEDIIGDAIFNQDGLYWESLKLHENENSNKIFSESIYSGQAGILLFLIALYKIIPAKKYMDTIIAGLKYLTTHCKNNPSLNFSFFSGRMGVCYVLLKAYDLTKDQSYLDYAIEFSKGCEKFIIEPGTPDDLLNGTAGTLLGLLHIYSYVPNQQIKSNINVFVRHIIKNSHLDRHGVFWDRTEQNSQGLCGFSHGASGVGWVLLEAGNFFKCAALMHFSMQALHYENSNFDAKETNWIDFRKGIYDEKTYNDHINAFQNNDTKFFGNRANYMASWCHGAPGIALCRLRYLEILNDPLIRKDIKRAVEKTKNVLLKEKDISKHVSFTLCHGFGGNSLVLLKAYQATKQRSLIKFFEDNIAFAVKHHQEHGIYYSSSHSAPQIKDLSLYMGNAGVGYFLLNALAPDSVENYLVPKLDDRKKHDNIDRNLITSKEIYTQLKKSIYPLTSEYIGSKSNAEISIDYSKKNLFQAIQKNLKSEVFLSQDETLLMLFFNENKKFSIRKNVKGFNYDYVRVLTLKQRGAELAKDDKELLAASLQLINTCMIFQADKKYLIIESYKGSNNILLNDINYEILNRLKRKQIVEDVISQISAAYETELRDKVAGHILIQIKEFLKAGILFSSHSSPKPDKQYYQ